MSDQPVPTILLPEPNAPVVAEYIRKYAPRDDSINILAQEVGLKESAAMLNEGKVQAVVVGATFPSKQVFLTAVREVGAHNKDASSFFVMEKEGGDTLYFADCAVNPNPDAALLARIAEQTCDSVTRLGDKPVVAFVAHEEENGNNDPTALFVMEKKDGKRLYLANYESRDELDANTLMQIAEETSSRVADLGDKPIVAFLSYSTSGSGGEHPAVLKVKEAAHAFRANHPDVTVYGDIQYDAARNEEVYRKKNKGETYINGEAPNVLVFPDADSADSVRKALLVEGDYSIIAAYPPKDMGVHRTSNGNETHPSIVKVRDAAAKFRAKHPDITIYPGVSYDAARNEEVYKAKHGGQGFINGETPNVFIFSNLDTGNNMYKTLEVEGGYSGVGPLMQGLDNNADFHDLSRGVTAESLERICLTVGKLVRSRLQAQARDESQHSDEDLLLAA